MKARKIFLSALPSLGVALVCGQIAVAQTGASAGGSITESPYKNGAPTVTGGYTDTSQGGTKTSGDMPVLPPSSSAPSESAKSGQKAPASPQEGEAQGGKAPARDPRG